MASIFWSACQKSKCPATSLSICAYLSSILPSLTPLWETKTSQHQPSLARHTWITITDTLYLDSVTGALCGLCLCGAGPSGHDLWGFRNSVSCCLWRQGKGKSSFWGSHWVYASPPQLQCCKHLNIASVIFCYCIIITLHMCTVIHEHTNNAHSKDSCNDHVHCEDGHHGNTSYYAGPAAALVVCALHANQLEAPASLIHLYPQST